MAHDKKLLQQTQSPNMTAQKRALSSNKKNQQQQQQKQDLITNKTVITSLTSVVSSTSSIGKKNTSTSSSKLEWNKSRIDNDDDGTTTIPRLPNTTIYLLIVYGSIAFFLGKKVDEYHIYQWTLYMRRPNNKDLYNLFDIQNNISKYFEIVIVWNFPPGNS